MYIKELGALLKLSVPIVLAQLAQTTLSFIDTIMVGRLGNDALAGIALGGTVFHFVLIVLAGVIFGVGPIVSQAIGAGDRQTAARATRQGLWLGLILSVPAMLIYWNIYPILIRLGQTPETALAASQYLRAISWGFMPALWMMCLRGLLEGVSNTWPIMLLAVSGVLLNVFLNDVLMFGKYGMPAMGLVGTGYASAIVFTSGFLIFAVYVHFQYADLHVFRHIRSPDLAMMKELVKVGGPIAMSLGFEVSMFSAAALAMGTLSIQELAAHQIALQSASIAFMIPLGFAIGTSVRVGHAIGRKSAKDAERAGHVGMLTCMVAMIVSASLFWLLPETIIGCYIDVTDLKNASVVNYATGFLAIAALFQIVDGLQVAAGGALRGLKDTAAAMVLSFISYWGVGAVCGYVFCFSWGYRGNGLWFGMTLGLATAALLLTIRFQWKVRRVL